MQNALPGRNLAVQFDLEDPQPPATGEPPAVPRASTRRVLGRLRRRRTRRRLLKCLGLGVVVAVAALAAASAAAAARSPVYYVALGDSLATGAQPSPSGQTGALRASNGTNRGYVDVLHDRARTRIPNLQLRNFGCGGETTRSLVTGGFPFDYRCGYGSTSQLAEAVSFLRDHRGEIAFVTIDVGANDVIWAGGFPDIQVYLPLILAAVRDAVGAGTQVVAMNYYDPFVAPVWFQTHDVGAVAAEAASLGFVNDFLEGIYAAAGVPVLDVEALFGVADTTLVDGVPRNVRRACEWTWICDAGDIHANDTGYRAIGDAFAGLILGP